MKHLDFWFDPVSPYAYLAFERLPQVLEGVSYSVAYRPLLFAGLLRHWGQKGPAEVEPKRAWTFRQVAWLAHRHGIELQTPAMHPFNPLPLLRLALACGGPDGLPNRRVVEALFHHVWRAGGAEVLDPVRLAALRGRLAPVGDPTGDAVKQSLRAATDAAIAIGVFGVPTVGCDGRLFWGLDGLDLLRAAIGGDPWFEGEAWDAAARQRPGVVR
jgi:2-hydroxychromene-2-carboxylate isomerase